VTRADDKRAAELAELARQFFLWLREHDLPGWSGSKGLAPSTFSMSAGAYRRLLLGSVVDFWTDPAEQRRLRAVGVGAKHVLLITSHDDSTWIADRTFPGGGTLIPQNGMYFPGDGNIERTGALAVAEPILDSSTADFEALGNWTYRVFAGFTPRIDLVWDDADEGERIHFDKRFGWVLDYEAPRHEFSSSLRDIIPTIPITAGVSLKEFRHYLYWNATYENRRSVREEGGDYYRKWKAEVPLDKKHREYRPTKLHQDYLRECFHEYVLKRNENYLLVQAPGQWLFLYALTQAPAKGSRPPVLDVKLVMKYQDVGKPRHDDEPSAPIRAVIFHAYDGSDRFESPARSRGVAELGGEASGRYAYDYKAAVRWFLGNKHLDPGSDEVWFDVFVRFLFPDTVYTVDGTLPGARVCTLTLEDLMELGDEATGILKEQADEMVAAARRQPNLRFVVQGWYYGVSASNRRQLIGVSAGHVYEWYPETFLVTRMEVAAWCRDNELAQTFGEVYEGSRGVIPFATVVTWGGVVVAGGAVIGGGLLANGVRILIRELSKQAAGKRAVKALVRKYRTQLTALVIDGILQLFPRTDNVYFELLRGFVHGFGAGAIEYYLDHVDDRLEKEVQRLYHIALNKLTGGVERAFRVYLKLSAAIKKLAGMFHALRLIWTPAFAAAAVAGLILLGRNLGLALIICLVVLFYVDYVYRSGKLDQAKRDVWARHQRQVLKLMIKETGADLAAYAEVLQEDLSGSKPSHDDVRARNDRIAAAIVDAVMKAPTEAPGVMDMLCEILAELGIDNWRELTNLGFLELLGRGWDAVRQDNPHLVAGEARVLGEALGELIGTFFLHRAMMPERWRKGAITGSRAVDKSIRTVVTGGTVQVLWKFARAPLDELKRKVPQMVSGLGEAASEHAGLFERVQRGDTRYRDFLQDLIQDERDLARSTAQLAKDRTLPDLLKQIAERARTEEPPLIEDMLAGDVEGWPRETLLFVLQTWLHVGLLHVLRAFEVLESDAEYGGKFRLATLLEIAGLDVSLDDDTARELAVTFERS